MDDIKARQQIIDKIKESSNILVTVSNDPSVDALSAALGLTLLIDKLEKYGTAVVSGAIPPAIDFLQPQKTFEHTTDSLRDFIIALDKEKADHLRVKPDGEVVKIYVTPYRTTITPDDLEFSQGDYNVELVIALGVDDQDHLDKALEAHGKILHDATVVTITAGEQTSSLGGIDWHDEKASSLSEMVTGLVDGLKKDKKALLDKQSATALLTGIVAETERFSNPRTTSRSMTIAATLMAAGADQQLIATQLEEHKDEDEPEAPDDTPSSSDDEVDSSEPKEKSSKKEASKNDEGNVLTITHHPHSEPGETLEEMDRRVKAEEKAEEEAKKSTRSTEPIISEEALQAAAREAEQKARAEALARVEAQAAAAAQKEAEAKLAESLSSPNTVPPVDETQAGLINDVHSNGVAAFNESAPSMGGTLNATTDEAEEDNRQELNNDQNRTILSHGYVGGDSAGIPGQTEASAVDPSLQPSTDGEIHEAYAFSSSPEKVITPPTPAEVATNFGVPPTAPLQPPAPVVPSPADLGLPMPPAVPTFDTPGAAPTAFTPQPIASAYAFDPSPIAPQPTSTPDRLGDILAPETGSGQAQPSNETPAPQPQPGDPGVFKIPGQN